MVAFNNSNLSGWLSRKYANQDLSTQGTVGLQKSQADLIRAQTAEEAANAAAQRAAQYGQAAAGQGQGALSMANAGQVPGLAQAEIQQRGAQAGLLGSEAGVQRSLLGPVSPGFLAGYERMSAPMVQTSPNFTPGPGQATSGGPMNTDKTGYAAGTSRVPGKGGPTEDNVSAHLSSGEAVLNKAAAEHLGRTTIDLLNAIGEQKMGLIDGGAETTKATPGGQGVAQDKGPDRAPGYARGTAKVAAKAPAKGKGPPSKGAPAKAGGKAAPPAQVSPQLLAALMQMGGGAPQPGGMPQPGVQQPMPMPMPMVGQ